MRSKKKFKTNRDYLDYAYEQLASAMEYVHNERQGVSFRARVSGDVGEKCGDGHSEVSGAEA